MATVVEASPVEAGREAAVRAAVLAGLGHPPGLREVAVRQVWGGHYRVNVHVGPDAVSTRIAHSYLVAVGANGGVLSADPPLARQYP